MQVAILFMLISVFTPIASAGFAIIILFGMAYLFQRIEEL
jgi:hypothetical protein